MFENLLGGKSPAEILAEEEAKAEKALADLAAAIASAGKQAPPPSSSPEFVPGVEYRIHFKNGNSGEYSGAALVHTFPFDRGEVVSIEAIG